MTEVQARVGAIPRARHAVRTVLVCEGGGRFPDPALTLESQGAQVRRVVDGFALVDEFQRQPADLVFIALSPNLGTQALDLLLSLHPSTTVVVYGDLADPHLLAAAVRRGARGVLRWAGPNAGGATGRRLTPKVPDNLTEREMQVLRGMADGRTNREIGRELFLTEDTIKTHSRRLFVKLDARDRAHAVAQGLRRGYIV
ncbi:response regulator transcription factor [Nakamurella flava]|uniref:Response regulator transcription factor n=1 Tax=Nakamurella flava TaxID=2576308 RepID=A0A4U6QBD0_9ACTN|nr:response regulator transcription factor [Nakamurella flava]TKV57344.1 response regulator transcription factor [Nakamurella flava]